MSLRLRLAIYAALAFIVFLIILELSLYLVMRQALFDEVDQALRARAMQVERVLLLRDTDLADAQLSKDVFVLSPTSPGQELSSPGIHMRVLLPDRSMLAASSLASSNFPLVEWRFQHALAGEQVFGSNEVEGTSVRLLYFPLTVDGDVQGVLQLGQSMTAVERTLSTLRSLLFVANLIVLLAGLIGGRILARQALRPVEQLTSTVAEIARTGSFNRRVTGADPYDEIGRLALVFNSLLDRLQQLLDRQHALVADTSHELRNPLMVLRGNLDLLAHDLPVQDRREAVSESIEEIDRMTRLVGDLLFLADADAEKQGHHQPVALEALLAAIAEDAAAMPTHDGHLRNIVLDANDAIVVNGDQERLRQLVWNLVENALRYTPPDGTIKLALRREEQVAVLMVSDTGIGIAPEHLERIFQRFYRVDASRSRALGGTGLGLSIVRQIAEWHGGSVRVSSTVGQGTTFTVRLPLYQPPSATP